MPILGDAIIPIFSQSSCPCLCFTANSAGSTVAMAVTGIPTLGQNFQYSVDNGVNWNAFTPGSTVITLANIGKRVYFKGNNPNGVNQSGSIYYKFVLIGSIGASGNIMSLIDDGACTATTIPNKYCFGNLFRECNKLTSAPLLPAMTLAENCYQSMFFKTSIVSAPALPATSLTRYCYNYMFSDCASLTQAPVLPSNNAKYQSYNFMFRNCTSLITPPALPAIYLNEECYSNMFLNCTSLTSVPKLPANLLMKKCYYNMFKGCTSLWVSDENVPHASHAWVIPTSGTLTNGETLVQTDIFFNCTGGRVSDDLEGSPEHNYTYYTQNPPIE